MNYYKHILLLLVVSGNISHSGTAIGLPHGMVSEKTASGTIGHVLSTVDTLWKENPGECRRYVGKIADTMNAVSMSRPVPDGAIILSTNDLQTLFAFVCRLPVHLKFEGNTLGNKWRMMRDLFLYVPALKTSETTWLDMAAVVGDMRGQLIPEHKPQITSVNVIDLTKTKAEMRAMQEENNRKNLESYYQSELRLLCNNLNHEIRDIRIFAQSLPPDKRKAFLGKIKELAHSGAEEAEVLDRPVEPEKVDYPPVGYWRRFLSRLPPGERQGLIDQAKRESSYTAEEIRLLEAPDE